MITLGHELTIECRSHLWDELHNKTYRLELMGIDPEVVWQVREARREDRLIDLTILDTFIGETHLGQMLIVSSWERAAADGTWNLVIDLYDELELV